MSIKVENVETWGFGGAIRGMRNPMNSWKLSDTVIDGDFVAVGDKDLLLMRKLLAGGPVHAKYLRMIHIQMDIVAPLYWWKEYDTYKVGTTANSCSTMHKLLYKEFEYEDFSFEKMGEYDKIVNYPTMRTTAAAIVENANLLRKLYLQTKDEKEKKAIWYAIIQLIPSSYNQRRTVDFNYQTAMEMIKWRENHKLDEWRKFVDVLKGLPLMEELLGVKIEME